MLGTKKFYGYRQNTIKNSEGKVIGEVVSIAILIDFEKRHPMKISPVKKETTDGNTLHISSEVIHNDNKDITTIHSITSSNYMEEKIISFNHMNYISFT